MKKQVKHIKLRLITLMTITCIIPSFLFFTGCGQSSQKPEMQQQSAQGQESQEKAPDKLKKLEESIEGIVSALEGPSAGKEEKKQGEEEQPQQNKQEQSGQEDKQQTGGQSEQQGSQEQSGQKDKQQGQKEQQPQQKPQQKDPWKEIGTIISNLHYQWNDYAPDAVKKGASRELTDKFSGNLNALTTEINKKDKVKTLASANKTYSGIADFYSLYRTKTSPEIKKMRYYARNAVLSAAAGDWNQAVSDSGNLKASWTMFKNTLSKEQQELSGKLDLAIYELDKVVTSKDVFLTDLKGRVVISDMAEIEKAAEKSGSGS